jgi:intracellular septation protein
MKILFDLLPGIAFIVALAITKDFYAATVAIMAASILQVAWLWLRYRRVGRMYWIMLALVLVFGALTLILHDKTILKWKPTVVNWLFGIAFLGSQFIGEKPLIERMMGHNMELPAAIWTRLNLGWVVFFILMGIANLYVAFNFDDMTWANFKVYGMLGLTMVFVVLQGFYLARYVKTDVPSEEK